MQEVAEAVCGPSAGSVALLVALSRCLGAFALAASVEAFYAS